MLFFVVEQLRTCLRKRFDRQWPSTREQYSYIIKIMNIMGGCVGGNIFSENFSSRNLYLRFVLFDVFVFVCINLYNLYITYGSLVEFMYCLETIFYAGVSLIKLYTFIWHRNLILKLHTFISSFIENYAGNEEQEKLLSNTVHNIYALAVLFGACSSSAAILIFLYSLVWSVVVEYALPFGFLIPEVAIDNSGGFALNYAFQLGESFLTVTGIVCSECAFFMFLLNACLQIDMIRLELSRLGRLCSSNDQGQHSAEIQRRIQTIIAHHIEHLDFTKTICDLFELHFFIVFGCTFFQLVSVVVVVVANPDWYPGYFLFLMLTFQLFFSCALGQYFDKKCDELTVAIYDVPWYNLKVQDQKAIRLLLLASQQPVLISYGFGSVNIRAFFEIYRKTYSIGMMMISVNEEN